MSASNTLKPAVVTDGKSTLRRRQTRQKRFYDRVTTTRASHRIGDNVRVRLHNTWDRAIVTGVCDSPRSYVVTTEDGSSYRRNERDSPAIVRSPLAAEPGTPTTRRGLVSELCHSPSQARRGSRLKSKPRWQEDFEMGVK